MIAPLLKALLALAVFVKLAVAILVVALLVTLVLVVFITIAVLAFFAFLMIHLISSTILFESILTGSTLLSLLDFSLTETFHSRLALGFKLFSGDTALTGVLHRGESLLPLLLFGLNRLFSLNTKTFLALLDTLLGQLLGYDAEALCPFELLALLLLEELQGLDRCRSSFDAWDRCTSATFTSKTSKASLTKLLLFLLSQFIHLLDGVSCRLSIGLSCSIGT